MGRITRWKGVFLFLAGAFAATVALVGCSPASELSVTFVDNDCFVIESGGEKILFDPHETLPQTIREQMSTELRRALTERAQLRRMRRDENSNRGRPDLHLVSARHDFS